MDKIIVLGTMEGYEKLNRVYSIEGISPTIETMQGGDGNHSFYARYQMNEIPIRENNRRGYTLMRAGGVLDAFYQTSGTRRGRVIEGGNICPTLQTGVEIVRMETKYRIRKLTEKECLRLMDVSDDDIEKITKAVSRSQCYKQAGNSIVVAVMVAIFDNLFNGADTSGQMDIIDLL